MTKQGRDGQALWISAVGSFIAGTIGVIVLSLILYELHPGPLLFQANKQFVWTVIGSMYICNVMLPVLNLPSWDFGRVSA